MHGECIDWGRGCGELCRQQPCPESFAAGEAPQPAGGLKHGSVGGGLPWPWGLRHGLALPLPGLRRALSAEFRAPRCGPCLPCRPPASRCSAAQGRGPPPGDTDGRAAAGRQQGALAPTESLSSRSSAGGGCGCPRLQSPRQSLGMGHDPWRQTKPAEQRGHWWQKGLCLRQSLGARIKG